MEVTLIMIVIANYVTGLIIGFGFGYYIAKHKTTK